MPVQIVGLLATIATVGVVLTVTVVCAVLPELQPLVKPTRLYVVLLVGLTTNGAVVKVCVEEVKV